VYEVVLLSLAENGGECQVRAPVRACADALTGAGATVATVTAGSDEQIDEVIARLPDGIRLVVATAVDAQLRAVVRRIVRRLAPPPSRRPDDLPPDRTVPDLPPLAVLPLAPADDLPARLGLPRDPAAVAAAVLGERVRRLDLLRHDGGSVTLDGALLGSSGPDGRAVAWRARVEVDDAVLSAGDEPLLAGVVANAGGYLRPDGLPLVAEADPTDGVVEAAVAVPVRSRWRRAVRVEVRRARGRAVVVRPSGDGVAYLDDGVAGELTRARSWWVEPSAWAVYTG
jgi:Diacylglycerol kinase catalytic domain